MTTGHGHAHEHGGGNRRRLAIVLGLTVSVLIVEVIGALVSGSLAPRLAGHGAVDRPASLTRSGRKPLSPPVGARKVWLTRGAGSGAGDASHIRRCAMTGIPLKPLGTASIALRTPLLTCSRPTPPARAGT
jgi:hypothetical protein